MQALTLSVVPLAFLIALFVVATVIQQRTDATAAAARRSTSALSLSDQLTSALTAESKALVAEQKRSSPANRTAFERAARSIGPAIEQLQQAVASEPSQRTPVARFAAATRDVDRLLRGFFERAHVRRAIPAVERDERAPAVTRRVAAWTAAKMAFEQNERALALARYDLVRRDFQRLEQLLLALAAAGIVVTLFAAAQFGIRITARLQRLADNARRLVDGEPPLPIGGNDEIADLDGYYREMTQRLERERRVAATLQRALLPQEIPAIPGIRVDTAYVSAGAAAEIGGDWYDVWRLGPDAIGISAGDVAGHGLRAATLMGGVRQSIRTAARVGTEPAAVLQHVNRTLCADDPDVYVTAFFAVLHLTQNRLEYALAGHPSPLVVRASGAIVALAADGLVLGVDPEATFGAVSVALEPGDGIVIYTDGIVEVDKDYLNGSHELERAVLDELGTPSENVADGIQQRIFRHREPRDDSAVLYLGRLPANVWTFDARDDGAAANARLALVSALAASEERFDLGATLTIFGELVGNVARHTPGVATVRLERHGDDAVVHIEDRGAPFSIDTCCPDVYAESGRGLFLVRALGRDVCVERTPHGNRVSVVLPLATAAPAATATA